MSQTRKHVINFAQGLEFYVSQPSLNFRRIQNVKDKALVKRTKVLNIACPTNKNSPFNLLTVAQF